MMYDVAIIGAGVIGSAIARELSKYDVKACVIEREEDVCCGTSKANSAIIHAGFDAKPGTLKAKLNVRGNEMMDQLSKDLDIPFKRNGSLVVCTKDQDPAGLEELLEKASVPVILKPNAGLPKSVNGKTVFDVTADEFADEVAALIKKGIRVTGGCCGTTPEYIKSLYNKTFQLSPVAITQKNITVVSSYTHAVEFHNEPILIGERINPTGKKRFKQALVENDIDYILQEGVNQQDAGVEILDVNVGLPEIDEVNMLKTAVCELQAIINT